VSSAARRVVAIDGPSGSGKSTVARAVGRALALDVLDTGAMYRAVTLAVLEHGVAPGDGPACAALAAAVRVDVGATTVLDGRDVTAAIRAPDVTASVSQVSAHPAVRELLVARQRAWVDEHGGGVVEGRDIGTVVFPGAAVKVFLTASDAERARRRHADELAAARAVEVDEVHAALHRRDVLDASRTVSPLRPADDAIVLDTTDVPVDDVVAEVVARFRAREHAE
jgi:cytidylate kinase